MTRSNRKNLKPSRKLEVRAAKMAPQAAGVAAAAAAAVAAAVTGLEAYLRHVLIAPL
jgi:mevalonate pyrophosphate decarboxylase